MVVVRFRVGRASSGLEQTIVPAKKWYNSILDHVIGPVKRKVDSARDA
jgi:hypothetical protein